MNVLCFRLDDAEKSKFPEENGGSGGGFGAGAGKFLLVLAVAQE